LKIIDLSFPSDSWNGCQRVVNITEKTSNKKGQGF